MDASRVYTLGNFEKPYMMKQTYLKEKIIGHRHVQSTEYHSPVEFHRRALALQARVERLNPFRRPRGFVFKAKTRDDYDVWKRQQTNPRLW